MRPAHQISGVGGACTGLVDVFHTQRVCPVGNPCSLPNPSSRIGAVFGWLPAVYQRVSLKGLHYGRGRLGWAAAVILGGGWGGNCNLSWLIRSCSPGSGWG